MFLTQLKTYNINLIKTLFMKLNFTYKKWQCILMLFMMFGFSNYSNAATYWIKSGLTGTAAVPLAWNVATNWTTGGATSTVAASAVPGAGDTVNILVGKYVSIPLSVTGTCGVLNVIGTTANLYLQGSALLNCTTVNINTGGNITMIATNPSSNVLTCTGNLNIGIPNNATATGKGTFTISSGSKIICGKMFFGTGTSSNVSTMIGRTNTSSTFEFTGNGTDVIPVLTGETTGTPDFPSVIFNPGIGNTITIPAGFCSRVLLITSGTVDFGNNYSTQFTSTTSSSLSMLDNTYLKIGGDKQLPNTAAYVFSNTSTIDFTGNTQIIRGIASGYKNLTLSGPGSKSLDNNVEIVLTLSIYNNVILDLANHNLTLSGNYLNTGSGCIRSSSSSNIWYKGYNNSSMKFDNSTPGTTNVLNNLTLGETEVNGGTAPSEANPLNLTIENELNIKGNAIFTAGHLVSNGNVVFKSDAITTAFVGPILDTSICGIIGDVKVERYIPATRAYRPLSSSVTGGSIFSNWQENGSTASLTGSIYGNTLTTSNPSTPLVVGQHISGNLIPANTTITSIAGAASNTYEISVNQNVTSRTMYAYTNISSTTIEAKFTGVITDNILTVSSFSLAGQLAVGQKITLGTLANTVITAQLTGTTGGLGTYTVGLEIPSGTIYYNGANTGFGTHVSGIACTTEQLGQYDLLTGIDYTRSGNPSLFTYDNALNGFNSVLNTKNESLVAGKPYLMIIRGDRRIDLALNIAPASNTTLRSTGTILAGDVDVTPSLNTAADSFNFIGNPYQAPVDLSALYYGGRMTDLGTSYTVFDTKINTRGGYVTYDFELGANNTDGSLADNTIEPNQAFFVTTSGASPSVIFNEADKVIDSNAYIPMFRSASNNVAKIKGALYASNSLVRGLDGFIVAFSDSYSNSIAAEDTKKPTGNQDELFASKNDVNKMGIDKRNLPSENEEIALSIINYRVTDYTLKFVLNDFDQMDAFLVDTYNGTETHLINNQENSYAFSIDAAIPATSAENRFKIVFRNSTLNTNTNSISQFTVFPNPVTENKFTVKTNLDFNGKTANLSIINYLGQEIYNNNETFLNDGSILVNTTTSISKGIYVLKVTVEGKVETKKLIIK